MNRDLRNLITQNKTGAKTLGTAKCIYQTDLELKTPFRTTDVGGLVLGFF